MRPLIRWLRTATTATHGQVGDRHQTEGDRADPSASFAYRTIARNYRCPASDDGSDDQERPRLDGRRIPAGACFSRDLVADGCAAGVAEAGMLGLCLGVGCSGPHGSGAPRLRDAGLRFDRCPMTTSYGDCR